MDILYLYQNFIDDLPSSYQEFKNNFNLLFPNIYDTKYLASQKFNLFSKEDKIYKNNEKSSLTTV